MSTHNEMPPLVDEEDDVLEEELEEAYLRGHELRFPPEEVEAMVADHNYYHATGGEQGVAE